MNTAGKRANFTAAQLTQYVPTKEAETSRLRTGYERIIAHRTKLPFAYAAKEDGVIVALDEDIKMVKIKYKDGTEESINYGEEYTSCGGAGIHITQKLTLNQIQLGSKFKRGDILCYNREYFAPDPYSRQVDWKIGAHANIAFIECDGTLDDSSAISPTLAEKLGFQPVFVNTITLTNDTNVHQIAKIGQHVESTDVLITFDESKIPESMQANADAEMIEMLNQLNRVTPKARHSGMVVKLEVFHTCELNELSPTLQTIVKYANQQKNARSRFAASSRNASTYQPTKPMVSVDRFGGVMLDADTVILKFYIQEASAMGAGSKIVFASSLKSVCGQVLPGSIEVEDHSVLVDGEMSYKAVSNRIVLDPIQTGICNRILAAMEEQAISMYFD